MVNFSPIRTGLALARTAMRSTAAKSATVAAVDTFVAAEAAELSLGAIVGGVAAGAAIGVGVVLIANEVCKEMTGETIWEYILPSDEIPKHEPTLEELIWEAQRMQQMYEQNGWATPPFDVSLWNIAREHGIDLRTLIANQPAANDPHAVFMSANSPAALPITDISQVDVDDGRLHMSDDVRFRATTHFLEALLHRIKQNIPDPLWQEGRVEPSSYAEAVGGVASFFLSEYALRLSLSFSEAYEMCVAALMLFARNWNPQEGSFLYFAEHNQAFSHFLEERVAAWVPARLASPASIEAQNDWQSPQAQIALQKVSADFLADANVSQTAKEWLILGAALTTVSAYAQQELEPNYYAWHGLYFDQWYPRFAERLQALGAPALSPPQILSLKNDLMRGFQSFISADALAELLTKSQFDSERWQYLSHQPRTHLVSPAAGYHTTPVSEPVPVPVPLPDIVPPLASSPVVSSPAAVTPPVAALSDVEVSLVEGAVLKFLSDPSIGPVAKEWLILRGNFRLLPGFAGMTDQNLQAWREPFLARWSSHYSGPSARYWVDKLGTAIPQERMAQIMSESHFDFYRWQVLRWQFPQIVPPVPDSYYQEMKDFPENRANVWRRARRLNMHKPQDLETLSPALVSKESGSVPHVTLFGTLRPNQLILDIIPGRLTNCPRSYFAIELNQVRQDDRLTYVVSAEQGTFSYAALVRLQKAEGFVVDQKYLDTARRRSTSKPDIETVEALQTVSAETLRKYLGDSKKATLIGIEDEGNIAAFDIVPEPVPLGVMKNHFQIRADVIEAEGELTLNVTGAEGTGAYSALKGMDDSPHFQVDPEILEDAYERSRRSKPDVADIAGLKNITLDTLEKARNDAMRVIFVGVYNKGDIFGFDIRTKPFKEGTRVNYFEVGADVVVQQDGKIIYIPTDEAGGGTDHILEAMSQSPHFRVSQGLLASARQRLSRNAHKTHRFHSYSSVSTMTRTELDAMIGSLKDFVLVSAPGRGDDAMIGFEALSPEAAAKKHPIYCKVPGKKSEGQNSPLLFTKGTPGTPNNRGKRQKQFIKNLVKTGLFHVQ